MDFDQAMNQETEESQSLPLLTIATASAFRNGNDGGDRRYQDLSSSGNQNISDETDHRIRGSHFQSDANDEADLNRPKKSLGYHFDCNICLESVEDPVVTRCGHLYCWPCLYKWLEPGISLSERNILYLNSSYNHDSVSEQNNLLQNGIPDEVRNESDERGFDPIRRSCPVCKAKCNLSTIVPIYVKNTKRKCTLNNEDESRFQDEATNQSKTPPRPNPFVQYPNTFSAIHNNNNNNNNSSNLAVRVPAQHFLSQNAITSSSFDQSIVPVLFGFPDMASQHSPPNLIARSRSLSSNSEVSPEAQREYILMEDATTNFLSKILLLMGSTVIFILFIF